MDIYMALQPCFVKRPLSAGTTAGARAWRRRTQADAEDYSAPIVELCR